ncbi:hypothetical protein OJ252_2277 [Cryptosporidium canis]|uniref:Uncharacterized protein n=1 Tax=Cryptosporidium canis TaxID=195482 RepID=A0ABQ8P5M3_9CRYT|nr:hypothetical protein OJ252_2277 [Cryptosporidium canis]
MVEELGRSAIVGDAREGARVEVVLDAESDESVLCLEGLGVPAPLRVADRAVLERPVPDTLGRVRGRGRLGDGRGGGRLVGGVHRPVRLAVVQLGGPRVLRGRTVARDRPAAAKAQTLRYRRRFQVERLVHVRDALPAQDVVADALDRLAGPLVALLANVREQVFPEHLEHQAPEALVQVLQRGTSVKLVGAQQPVRVQRVLDVSLEGDLASPLLEYLHHGDAVPDDVGPQLGELPAALQQVVQPLHHALVAVRDLDTGVHDARQRRNEHHGRAVGVIPVPDAHLAKLVLASRTRGRKREVPDIPRQNANQVPYVVDVSVVHGIHPVHVSQQYVFENQVVPLGLGPVLLGLLLEHPANLPYQQLVVQVAGPSVVPRLHLNSLGELDNLHPRLGDSHIWLGRHLTLRWQRGRQGFVNIRTCCRPCRTAAGRELWWYLRD